MRIRTLTGCIGPGDIFKDGTFEGISDILHGAKLKVEDDGPEVQTLRISTDLWFGDPKPDDLLSSVLKLEDMARDYSIDFLSIGPARNEKQIEMIPNMIESSTKTCSSATVASPEQGVMTGNVLSAAKAVKEISNVARDGSKNFMFASTACCGQDIPFFPASYHSAGPPSIMVGLENGDLVQRSSLRASGLKEVRKMLIHLLREELDELHEKLLGTDHFKGIDLSLAPGLEEDGSIGLAVENMTGSPFGSMGTLSACSELTRAIRDLGHPIHGYSGLMLPVLEDEGLGRGADKGSFSVQDLLLYSSVCGTGLDAVPIPGNTPVPDIASTILDMASLSFKWKKPLSARLLPIPDGGAGDMTDLGSPYLRDCSILPL